MDRIKAWSEEASAVSRDTKIAMALTLLEASLEDMDEGSDEYRNYQFLIEQLKLAIKTKYSRAYSPQLLIMAYRLHASSATAYKVLKNANVICLPSTTTLRKVTRRLNDNSGLSNTAYLKLRWSKLNQFDRNVLLMIDEIYVAKRVEYSNGEIIGLTPDGEVASTLLCFMIKSLTSKYRDLVAMYPMAKLTAQKLYGCFREVLSHLHSISFNVIAISVDMRLLTESFSSTCCVRANLNQASPIQRASSLYS